MLVVQMMRLSPTKLILLGGGLLLLGVVLPLLMVMKILESTYFLNFFAYIVSLSGFFLGLIGAMTYVREKRR
jgi:hypothetical protein